jgi:hypothetical protein
VKEPALFCEDYKLFFQTGSGAFPAFYPKSTEHFFPRVQWQVATSVEVKNIWIYRSIPPYDFMA